MAYNIPNNLSLNTNIGSNSIYEYIVAAGLFCVLVLLFKGVQWLTVKSLSTITARTKTYFDDALVTVVETIRPPFYSFIAFYLSLLYLKVEGFAASLVTFILISWSVYQVIVALQIILDFYLQKRFANASGETTAIAQLIRNLSQIVLWALGILFILQNLGINATSLIAGLGIGGVAIALAAKNILADLFSSLAIYFDQPFVPGDLITIGSHSGIVQKIGIKTTRLLATNGEEIIVPNTQLTDSLLKNIGQAKERRVEFSFGVAYGTPLEKLKKVPDILQQIVGQSNQTRFLRAHFHEISGSAIKCRAVYYVKNRDYDLHLKIQEEILLALKEKLNQEKITIEYAKHS